jgi:uncharacterized membrane protein YbhN (UPF0104 family)
MKKTIQIFLTYTLIFFIIRGFISLFLNESYILNVINTLTISVFIEQIILAILFAFVSYNLQNQILRSFKVKLKPSHWIGIGYINTMFNYILPFKSGVAIKSLFLKNKYNFKISHCLSIMIYIHFSLLKILLFLSTITFLTLKLQNNTIIPNLNVFLLISITSYIFALFIPKILKNIYFSINTTHNDILNRLKNISNLLVEGILKISKKKKLALIVTFSNILIIFIQFLRLFSAYKAVSDNTSIFHTMFINILYCLSSFIHLTPGNLGLQEIIISLSSTLINVSKEEGLIASGIIRIVALVIVFTVGPMFYFLLKVNKTIFKSETSSCKH